MITTNASYKSIISGRHTFECRIIIGTGNTAKTFGMSSIRSLKITGGLFSGSTLSFGGCFAREVEIEFYPTTYSPPRMAEIEVQFRAKNSSQTSVWYTAGHFFFDTRDTDESGVMTVKGYDVMLKAEKTYIDPGDVGNWPRKMSAVAADIASKMGVTVDSRSTFKGYDVQLPTEYTMREVLGYIAAAHCANWVVTPAGTLRMVAVGDTVDSVTLGKNVMTFESGREQSDWTHVIINTDDETYVEAVAATDDGRTLELTCPWGTTAMAQNILDALDGYVYRPYSASGALIDPAAEIGDTVVVNGVTSVLAACETTFDTLCAADISAPSEDEIDHEYPYISSVNRQIKRRLKTIETTLYVGTESIVATVKDIDGRISEITQTTDGIVSTVTAVKSTADSAKETADSAKEAADGASTKADELETVVSTVSQTADKINWLVKSGTSESDFTMTDRAIEQVAEQITLTGYVTFNDLAQTGKTTINGSNITTGTISAERIDASELKISKIFGGSTRSVIAIDCTSTDTMYIGGSLTGAANYSAIRLYAQTVEIGSWSWTDRMIIDTSNREIRTNDTTGNWDIGSSTYPWGNIYLGDRTTGGRLTIQSSKLFVDGSEYKATVGDVSTLKSGTYSTSLSSKVLTPGSSDAYDLGTSSVFWANAYIKSLKICYSSTRSVALACDSSGKLTVGGSAIEAFSPGSSPSIIPSSYDTYNLGSSSKYWDVAYVSSLQLCYSTSRSVALACNSSGQLTVGGSVLSSFSPGSAVSLIPSSKETYDLGSTSYYWKYLYTKTVRLYYNSYTYVDLACNSSGKLTSGSKVVTTA